MPPKVPVNHEAIEAFCKRHHVKKLSFFGSVLRYDFREDSDIDVLVEFAPKHVPSLFRMVDLEDALSQLLAGRKVELRTANELNRHFRDEVLRMAEVQYATR